MGGVTTANATEQVTLYLTYPYPPMARRKQRVRRACSQRMFVINRIQSLLPACPAFPHASPPPPVNQSMNDHP